MALELTPPACILFDCDGTLVDSEELGNDALAEEFAAAGIAETGAALTARYRGHRFDAILADVQARHGVVLPDGFADRYRERAAALFEREVRAMPGAAAMLAALQARGIATCVASNGPLAKIRQNLRVSGLAPHFGERLFSAYEVGAWKPDPGLFLHAAAAMGVAPARCLVVDDSQTGVEAAGRAGMRALWFRPPAGALPPHAATLDGLERLVAALD